jgi:predicted nucleotidyltransferase
METCQSGRSCLFAKEVRSNPSRVRIPPFPQNKKMKTKEQFENLTNERNYVFKLVVDVFKDLAVEGHVFGSLARGNSDEMSDVDIWFTFNDEDFEKIKEIRFDLYSKIGESIITCEPPQNAPINGFCTSLIIKTKNCILIKVDLYLCPKSSSFAMEESRKLFGIDIPVGKIEGYNPQKISVPEDYQINFFINFIFGTIKNIKRKKEDPLEDVLRQYESLKAKHGILVDEIKDSKHDIQTLELIIFNTKKVSNEKQKLALDDICIFLQQVFV